MSYALSSGVTGLLANQEMLDVAGNNLANINTTAFKASRISFSALLGQTLAQASQPTSTTGGTNPEQIGSGVGVVSITPDTGQGSIVDTGNELDMAIDGSGYFVVNDGSSNLYTRAGTFGVDANGYLVDTASGYMVQRVGTVGENDGFQVSGDSSIRVPYNMSLPASATTNITVTGNLSSDATDTATTQVLSSSLDYTVNDGQDVTEATTIGSLDQFTGGSGTGGHLGAAQSGTITITGYQADGTAINSSLAVTATSTLGNLITQLNTVLTGATATLVDGSIRITDNASGYSRSDLKLAYSGNGQLETPAYFEMTTVGGEEVKNVSITIYDSLGGGHVLSGAFVRTDTANTWDLVLSSVTGDVSNIDIATRRIRDITFDSTTGAYVGMGTGETGEFNVTFAHDASHTQTIDVDLGTAGSFDGITQFAGTSTAVADEQDGYAAGSLESVSVSDDGVLLGVFSNGVKKDLAVMAVAIFNNPAGLQSVGGSYYASSGNSGEAILTQATSSGAGSIKGGALEKSNADVATEFVNLIQAQNGYQANARTIKVANEILQELTNLIR
jgi:flagellar hook protein FlgE